MILNFLLFVTDKKDVVQGAAPPIHIDLHTCAFQPVGILRTGKVTPLVAVPDPRRCHQQRLLDYLPPAPFCALRSELEELLRDTWNTGSVQMHSGASWTTDAPFRETEEMIATCRANGILAVEMAAAALQVIHHTARYLHYRV